MHPLLGAQPVPYVPVRVTRGTLVAHWNTCAPAVAEPRSSAGLSFLLIYPKLLLPLLPSTVFLNSFFSMG